MMTPRADQLLARAWQRARQQILPSEGFLEDALAAALEHPAVWPQLVRHFGWSDLLPCASPTVITQRADALGRTDIELVWPDGDSSVVIFELKVQAPPTAEQVGRYLARENSVVIGIGAWSNADALRAELPIAHVSQLIDVVTWSRLRSLAWDDAPLEFRQLHNLLDAMGVAVPRTNEQQLAGLATALPLLPLLDTWIPAGLAEVRDICTRANLTVARPARPRFDNGWYAGYLNGQSNIPAELTIWGGLVLQEQHQPLLLNELPDLALLIEINQDHPLAQRLRTDEEFSQRCEAWAEVGSATEPRTVIRVPGEWGLLAVRTSSDLLLRAADQQEAFVGWLRDAATALEGHGILSHIAMLAWDLTARE